MNIGNHHRATLRKIARQAMLDRGLLPDFSPQALAEVKQLKPANGRDGAPVRDMRERLWASIDNDDSRDLDQLTSADSLPGDRVRIYVAVADVDCLVKKGTAIDGRARHNTSSVYTAAEVFPMLPEKLSTDMTSLNFSEDRLAVVVEMVVDPDGIIEESDIYRALVHNHARLTYRGITAWLNGDQEMPEAVAAVKGLEMNLRLQDRVTLRLRNFREMNGALDFDTISPRPVFDGDDIRDIEPDPKNRAKDIIEDFMIAANGVTARFLEEKGFPSIRRVVREPKRWDRIVQVAAEYGAVLPATPDSKALDRFLASQRAADPMRFPDLSLSIIKLMGAGEYTVEIPGEESSGHFGLAVNDYTHSTAPNRRYPDLITQRLLKAALDAERPPYSVEELQDLAAHCTKTEGVVDKVERQVNKSAAALLLQSRIGDTFDAIVTGAASKGTWARLFSFPVEGRVEQGFEGLDVGDRIRVKLVSVDVERGFIDFARINRGRD